MGVTVKSTNGIPDLMARLKQLGDKHVDVGLFGKDSNVDKEGVNLVTLGRVHEFGMTIRPKNKKALAVPLEAAKGRRPADVPGLFRPKGKNVLVVADGKGRIKPMFVLLKSVTIPERSFLRAGFDRHIGEINAMVDSQVDSILHNKINPDTYLDMLGLHFAGLIQHFAIYEVKSPPNAPLTVANKGSSNPLVDTGRMIGAIRHEVRKGT